MPAAVVRHVLFNAIRASSLPWHGVKALWISLPLWIYVAGLGFMMFYAHALNNKCVRFSHPLLTLRRVTTSMLPAARV